MLATFRIALKQAFPILLFHGPLGIVCGVLFKEAGYAWYVAPLFSLFVFAGAMQLLTLSILAAGGSIPLLIASLIPVGVRNIFYGLTMLERYRSIPWPLRGYLSFTLVDGIYSILHIGPRFEAKKDAQYITYLSLLAHSSWVFFALIGSFVGQILPIPEHLEFVLTTFFAAAACELFIKVKQKKMVAIAALSLLAAIALAGRHFLLPAILFSVASCLMLPQEKEATT